MTPIVIEYSQDRQFIYTKINPSLLRQALAKDTETDFEGLFFEALMESGYSSFSYQLDTEQLEDLSRMPWKTVRQNLVRRIAVRTDFSLSVDVSSDHMIAEARIQPAFGEEKITAEQIAARLEEQGIIQGIDQDVLKNWAVEKNWNTSQKVAHGEAPIAGKNEGVKPLENIAVSGIWKEVAAEQPIAQHYAATQGIAGYTVRGKTLPALAGKPRKAGVDLFIDKNISSTDDVLTSKIAGILYLSSEVVCVSPIYSVQAEDLDKLTELCHRHETLWVHGDIESLNLTVQGHLRVSENCHNVNIQAGGQVLIEGKLTGPSALRAGGACQIHEVRESLVYTAQNLSVDMIHSTQVFVGGLYKGPDESVEHVRICLNSEATKDRHPLFRETRQRLSSEYRRLGRQTKNCIQELIKARKQKNPEKVSRKLITYERLERRMFFLQIELNSLIAYRNEQA